MRAGVVVAAEPGTRIRRLDGRTVGRRPAAMLVRRRRARRSTRRHRRPRERLSPHRGSGSLGSERAQRVAPRPRDRERRRGACCRGVVPRPPDQATGTSRSRAAARLGRRRLDARCGAHDLGLVRLRPRAARHPARHARLRRLPGLRRRSTSSAPTGATMRAARFAAGRSRRSSPPIRPGPGLGVLPHRRRSVRTERARASARAHLRARRAGPRARHRRRPGARAR